MTIEKEENKKPTDGEIVEVKGEYDDLGLVKGYVCSRCGAKVKFSHQDDVGTKFFTCEKCGSCSSKLMHACSKEMEKRLGA